MQEFRVSIPHKPGELAKLSIALGEKGVNISSIASVVASNPATVAFVTNQVKEASAALEGLGLDFEVVDLLTISLSDNVGELGMIAEQLANAHINVESVYVLGKCDGHTEVGLTTDNDEQAKELLGI